MSRPGRAEAVISVERIARSILVLRAQRVILDEDLAALYEVEIKVLNRAVKRNLDRFPEDFMFQLTAEEFTNAVPAFAGSLGDYRLSRNPFFFKFVKRKIVDDSHQSFLVSLDHLNQILAAPKIKGPKGGVRVSYEALDGTYLRETDPLGLIRSGFVGTYRAETEALATIIAAVATGNRALVLAWQQKVQDGVNEA